MTEPFKLKRTRQCEKCPWRKDVDPRDIPNGYSIEKHLALACTIADPDDPLSTLGKQIAVMACHETENAHCIGWLVNQLDANNIALRMQMLSCENRDRIKLVGEQHACFEDTIPIRG